MTRVSRVCVLVAGTLSVAGCASWSPSLDFLPSFTPKPVVATLTIESDPPGADARTSLGPTCRTPCTLSLAADREFTVNFTLNGYLPQSVPIQPKQPQVTRDSAFIGSTPTTEFTPNPVLARLDPAPPQKPPKKVVKKKRPKAKRPPPPPQQ